MPSLELVPTLDLIENDALLQIVNDPVYSSALKKLFARHEQYFKDKVTDTENIVPETLDAEMKKRTLAGQYAAQARMWATAWAEIEMYVSEIQPEEG